MNDRRWVRYQLDSGERISRKMQLDLVDKLIEINRKLNEVKRGRALLPDRKQWGLRDVADAVRNFDRNEELKRREAELDKKLLEIKQVLGVNVNE